MKACCIMYHGGNQAIQTNSWGLVTPVTNVYNILRLVPRLYCGGCYAFRALQTFWIVYILQLALIELQPLSYTLEFGVFYFHTDRVNIKKSANTVAPLSVSWIIAQDPNEVFGEEKNNKGELLWINYECTREDSEPNVPCVEFNSASFPGERL